MIRMIVILHMCLFTAAPALAFQQPPAVDWPAVPVMPGASTGWVARNMTYNGIPMRIEAFTVQVPPAQVIDFYRSRWRGDGAHTAIGFGRREEWKTVWRHSPKFFTTVQIRAVGGHTEGMIVWSLSPLQVQPSRESDLPLPGDVKVINRQVFWDGPVVGESLLLRGNLSVSAESRRLSAALRRHGWHEIEVHRSTRSPGVEVRYFDRKGEQIEAVLQRNAAETLILVNWQRS